MPRKTLKAVATNAAGCKLVLPGLFLLLILNVYSLFAQTTTSSSPQVQALQLQAWSALMGTAQPNTVVLDGTFTSTAGSEQDSGNVQLSVASNGGASISRSGSLGTFSESRTVADGIPACTWTGSDGAVHNSTFVNCVPPAWFFPGLTLLSNNSNTGVAAWAPSAITSNTLGNHLQYQFVLTTANGVQETPQSLKPFDLVLDPVSNLPRYALFTLQPDTPGAFADIAVQISYSNYKSISGVMIPFRIRRFVNGSLVLDITISAASVQ